MIFNVNLSKVVEEEGGMITHGVLMVNYIGPDGREQWAYTTIGDPAVHQTLGLMAVVQHSVAAQVVGEELE